MFNRIKVFLKRPKIRMATFGLKQLVMDFQTKPLQTSMKLFHFIILFAAEISASVGIRKWAEYLETSQ